MGSGLHTRARGRGRQAASRPLSAGGRGWIKRKNRDYWRYEMERESAINRTRGADVRVDGNGALVRRGAREPALTQIDWPALVH